MYCMRSKPSLSRSRARHAVVERTIIESYSIGESVPTTYVDDNGNRIIVNGQTCVATNNSGVSISLSNLNLYGAADGTLEKTREMRTAARNGVETLNRITGATWRVIP